MLTAEQIEIRKTGIGASEISQVFEMHPYRAGIDLWLEKTGLAERPDNDADEERNEKSAHGSRKENIMRDWFEEKTKKKLRRIGPITGRHPVIDCVLASPDDLLTDERAGLEIKIVGSRMAHHWEGETLPDYVRLQCAQNIAVYDCDRWYVAAEIGGTTLARYTVERDMELELAILEQADVFWQHVLNRVAPPIPDPNARRRYLRARYPGSGKNVCRKVGDDPQIRDLMEALAAAKADEDAAKERKKRIENELLELVGDDYGLEGVAGKFIAPRMVGSVAWKEVALELSKGCIPDALIEKYRGAGFLSPRFNPAKEAKR